MNLRTLFVWSAVLIMTSFIACEEPTTTGVTVTGQASVSGTVLEENSSPIEGATVLLSSVLGSRSTSSDSLGRFTLTVDFDSLQAAVSAKIEASKAGFKRDSTSLFLAPGNNISGLNFVLRADTGAAAPPPPSPGASGDASNIVLVSSTSSNVNVRGSGGPETATMTFEVRDANGIPVDSSHQTTVQFTLAAGPGGGEFLSPTSAITNAQTGQAKVTLNSGTIAGVAQIQAQATVGAATIRSTPVAISIFGGLPDKDHFFTFWETLGSFLNIPAGSDARFQARVGDKFSNPVRPGTVVSFSSTLGIVTPQAITDNDGLGSALLSTAGESRRGSGQVFATTVGESGAVVRDTLSFLLSGEPTIQVTGNPNNFLITDNGFATFNYRVSDAAGNPLAKGSTINVSLDGTAAPLVDLDGDFDVTVPNTSDATTWTNFAFSIRDPDVGVTNASGTLVVTIRVSGPNGDQQFSFSGGFQGTGGPPPGGSGDAASFVLVSLSPSEISVRGVGGVETATIVFEARDNQGRAVDTDHAVTVTFAILSGPGGGEFITPTSALTDAAGRARATINGGTISGPMQIQAQATVGALTVRSTPVQLAIASGLPDQAHFSVATARLNFWGWDFINNRMGAVVLVGDKYSNPVKQGTVVSFRTDGNIVAGDNLADVTGGSSLTDGAGVAVATIISGKPQPRIPGFGRDGYGYLKAQTVGLPIGTLPVIVRDSALYVTSSDIALLTVSPTTFTIPAGGSQAFTVTVEDVNGNPIVGGSTINVSTSYVPPDGSDIKIVIDPASFKVSDSLFPGSGRTTFTFSIFDATSGGTTPAQQVPVTVRATHAGTTTQFVFSFSGTVGG